MTIATGPTQLWNILPGWGINANLTPPEIINSREVRRLRKWLICGLGVLLIVCAGGYVLAARQHSAASQALDQVQARTSQLEASTRQYAGVTRIQGSVTQVQSQIAQLMNGDVDLAKLMASVRSSLPAPMTITSETITIVTDATPAGAGSGLDTSGLPRIGNVVIAGTGRTLDDLSAYVDNLEALPGIVSVVPTSNARALHTVSFSVSLGLTNARISHRFDVVPAPR